MGFFSKSKQSNGDIQDIFEELLAEYFVVDHAKVKAWVSTNEKEVVIGFPFAVTSQFEVILSWLQSEFTSRFPQQPLPNIQLKTDIPVMQTAKPPLVNVKNIIAVASGKGGVGKSATTINLAYALQQEGARVGILDADIYGPSVPIMLGNPKAHPVSEDSQHMRPIEVNGLVANSIGYLVPAENATVWRGPMASRALQQLLNDTQWPVLDYLLVDMPPGTGDIQLTMSQQVPLTAAVIVTTPQDIALADATKGIAMFEKVQIPVLGLIENMSYYQCKKCGEREYVFATDGGQRLADRHNIPLIGTLPLDIKIREHADSGESLLLKESDSPLAESYRQAARTLSQQLAFSLNVHPLASNVVRGEPISVVNKP
ncbi:iron-sulfur cluster carrier protein ApbC [Alteromonas facilis]|uniref:iron-sulfur cluster carrier protein ApbC n=1 Tax=Alteromonas facilis TaxID=2048004 RepID=UPI001F0C7A9C|nr:iron-sulfur cluster carrier protein ApbC [Alteromonas facilis]